MSLSAECEYCDNCSGCRVCKYCKDYDVCMDT